MSTTDQCVQIDLHVVMKIMQNLMDVPEASISCSTGALVGLPTGQKIEITNCFQFPTSNYQDYNTEMVSRLEKQDCENMIVGLYTAIVVDSFMSEDFLTKLHMYQSSIKECVVLVFDYVKISHGIFYIKAYRLNRASMELISSRNFSQSNFENSGVTHQNLLLEIPVFVRISQLSNILVKTLQNMVIFPSSLDFDHDSLIDKKLYLLLKSLKDLTLDFQNIQSTCREMNQYYTENEQIDDIEKDENDKILNGNSQIDKKDSSTRPSINYLSHLINSWSLDYLNAEAKSCINSTTEISKNIHDIIKKANETILE